MSTNKVLFLDVDGVLNYDLWYTSDKNPGNLNGEEDVDPECVDKINNICNQTDTKIVISSDWRIASGWKNRLEKAGLQNIIDKTPITIFRKFGNTYHFSRGEEIDMWLQWHPEVTNYVIVDDRDDMMNHQLNHFVKINAYRGLQDKDCEEIIKILTNGN